MCSNFRQQICDLYKKNSFYKKKSNSNLVWHAIKKLKLFLLMNVSNFFVDIYFGEEVLYACVWFFPFLWHPLTQAFRAMIIFHPNNLQLHIFFSYLIRGFILRLIFILQMLKEKKVYKVFQFFSYIAEFWCLGSICKAFSSPNHNFTIKCKWVVWVLHLCIKTKKGCKNYSLAQPF